MKNKIILLRGKMRCRILDTIIENGYTLYFVVDIKTENLTLVHPRDILDIMDYNDKRELVSINNILAKEGI